MLDCVNPLYSQGSCSTCPISLYTLLVYKCTLVEKGVV